ncbi:MAG: immunity 26/phosphotriesterase HocA family protein [Bacillaceae bacterium]|nr:immunity 26/phosphotriesterase HocA family protein [Bacillaceae bacterium]
MKKYKRLKLIRMLVPLIMVIPVVVMRNFLIVILTVIACIIIDLIFIEPKLPRRNKRQEGEVFIVEPMKDTFLFGKVIRTNIPTNEPTMSGGHLVYIYQETSNPMEIPNDFDPTTLLMPPQIVDNQAWEKGYFQSVGIQQVTKDERDVNYGFWDVVTKKFVNEEGTELNQTPKVYDDYGLTSYGSIKEELRSVLT